MRLNSPFRLEFELKLDSIILIRIKRIDLISQSIEKYHNDHLLHEFTSVLLGIVSLCPFLNVFHLLAKITCTIILQRLLLSSCITYDILTMRRFASFRLAASRDSLDEYKKRGARKRYSSFL